MFNSKEISIGDTVELNLDLVKDEDLTDFMEEFSSDFKVIVTYIEEGNFWGHTTGHVQVPVRMEANYVENIEKTNIDTEHLGYLVDTVERCSLCGKYELEEELSDIHGFTNICDRCVRGLESRGFV